MVAFVTVPAVETALVAVVEVHEENQDNGAEAGAAATDLFSREGGILECQESSLTKLAFAGPVTFGVAV